MNDSADKRWLRQVSKMYRFRQLLIDMASVAVVVGLALFAINRNEARAGRNVCPKGAFCLLLPNSMLPASGDECFAARPDLGRPYFTASKRDRTNEPYHSRICYFTGKTK